MKILYIEDDSELGMMISEILSVKGHMVVWVQDRSYVNKHDNKDYSAYDLVISDFEVPGGTFQHTKECCEEQGVPLLLASGSTFAFGAPHENYLPKPFNMEQLLTKISDLMNVPKKLGNVIDPLQLVLIDISNEEFKLRKYVQDNKDRHDGWKDLTEHKECMAMMIHMATQVSKIIEDWKIYLEWKVQRDKN